MFLRRPGKGGSYWLQSVGESCNLSCPRPGGFRELGGSHYIRRLHVVHQCICHGVKCKMYIVICVLQVVHVLLQRTVKSALYILQCKVYTIQCKVYTIQCTLIHVLLHILLQPLALRWKSAGPGTVPRSTRKGKSQNGND